MKKLLGHKRITSMALSALLLLSAASAALTASAAAENLTVEQINEAGNFEGESYSPFSTQNATLTVSNEKYFSGAKSLKLVATADNAEFLINPVALEKSSAYKLSFALYVEKMSNTSNVLNIKDRVDFQDRLNVKLPKKVGKWRIINVYLNTIAKEAPYRIGFQGLSNGATLYFDDIKIEKVTDTNYLGKITNSDFEDTDYGLVEWSNESVLEMSDVAKTGDWSAYIYGTVSDPDSGVSMWQNTQQLFAVERNTYYRLTYYAKCLGIDKNPIIKIFPSASETSNENILGGDKVLNQGTANSTEWNKNTVTFNSGDNNLLRLFLVVNNYGAYIDDISIDKLYSSVVYATGRGDAAASRESFTVGEAVTLTATPAEGAEFLGWYNGETIVSTDAAYTFTPTDSFCYTARFTPISNSNVIEFVNPGFESDDLSAWSNQTPFEIISTDKHSGEQALRVKANGEVAQWAKSYKGFYIEPNTDYVVHFYGKRESGDESYTLVHIMDKSNNKIKGDIGVNGLITGYDSEGKAIFDHSQWGLNEIKFNSGSNNYVRLCFQVSKGASYIDDIYIARKVGTYSSENKEFGTVKGTAPTLCYGEEFTITAEPKDGYVFAGWYNSANELVSENAVYTNTLTSNESYVAKFAENTVIKGDVNGDGNVDATDLTVLRKVLLGIETSNNANVNGDKNVDILDYIALKKLLAK